jgi:hypothetical protein
MYPSISKGEVDPDFLDLPATQLVLPRLTGRISKASFCFLGLRLFSFLKRR